MNRRVHEWGLPLVLTGMVALTLLYYFDPFKKTESMPEPAAEIKPTPIPLTLSTTLSTVMKGEGVRLNVSGGTPPFQFILLSGGGTLNSADGWYVANTSAGTKVEVMVQDGAGASARHTLTVTESRCEPSEKQNCGFNYSGLMVRPPKGTPNLHCRITYYQPRSNLTAAKELEYYTACGTCREGAFGGRTGPRTHVEAPISVVTSLGKMMICKGKPGLGEPSQAHHVYKVETLTDSSCQLHDQYITYATCVPYR